MPRDTARGVTRMNGLGVFRLSCHEHPMLYTLNADCPVKWTALQERGLSRDFPVPTRDSDDVGEGSRHSLQRIDGNASLGAKEMVWTYARWLWLPDVSLLFFLPTWPYH